MRRALLTLTLAAAAAGCGGDSQLSADQYRAELRKICDDSDEQSARIMEPTRATNEAIADYLGRLREINTKTIERVERLEPPDDLRAAHERALSANREGREKVDDVIAELEGGGDATEILAEARRELQETGTKATRAAKDLGVPACAD